MIAPFRAQPAVHDDPYEPLVRLPRDEFLRVHIDESSSGSRDSLERWGAEAQEQSRQQGIEALAWYRSFRRGNTDDKKWGITIRRAGVRGLGFHLHRETNQPLDRCLKAAFRALYEHELFHFQVDCGFVKLESVAASNVATFDLSDKTALYNISRKVHSPWDPLEEALANARAIRKAKNEFRPALRSFFVECPPGYRDFAKFSTSSSFNAGLDGLFNLSETILQRKPLAGGVGRVINLDDPELNGQHVPVYLRLD